MTDHSEEAVVERCALAANYRHSSSCATGAFVRPQDRGPCNCGALADPLKMLFALTPGDRLPNGLMVTERIPPSVLAAMRHCRDVLATNGFETDAVTLNSAVRELKHAMLEAADG